MVYSSKGLGEMSRTYHRIYRKNLSKSQFNYRTPGEILTGKSYGLGQKEQSDNCRKYFGIFFAILLINS